MDEATVMDALAKAETVKPAYGGRRVAEKTLDEKRVLRVVFVEEVDVINVVTVYPARRGRYD
ncbi:MAG: hypothetical protein V3W11_05980 [bacterium]